MTERYRLPGPRDVRASLDSDGPTGAIVVACPPHPKLGGDRHDGRLQAVSDALVAAGIDCLRIDYGAWDGGEGERTDARTALGWAGDRYDRVGLFGFSFGGAVALLAAVPEGDRPPDAVSALAPAARLSADLDAADALGSIGCPVQVVYGERDDTADWQPVADRARELGSDVDVASLPADHFFVGQKAKVAAIVGTFLADRLGAL